MEWYYVWWPWLTSKCFVRVCQHQLSFLLIKQCVHRRYIGNLSLWYVIIWRLGWGIEAVKGEHARTTSTSTTINFRCWAGLFLRRLLKIRLDRLPDKNHYRIRHFYCQDFLPVTQTTSVSKHWIDLLMKLLIARVYAENGNLVHDLLFTKLGADVCTLNIVSWFVIQDSLSISWQFTKGKKFASNHTIDHS